MNDSTNASSKPSMTKKKTHSRFVVVAMVILAIAAVTAVSSHASAQEPPPGAPPPISTSSPPAVGGSVGYFGERGQIVISGDFKFHLMRESVSMNGPDTTSFEIQPALDYFVSTNVSVGGLLGYRYDSVDDGPSASTLFVGPRIGYNIPVGASASLWIRAALTYERQTETVNSQDRTGYAIPISVYAPLLWHPASHFFIGVGPFLGTDLVAKLEGQNAGKRTDFGISSTVGGYFGGL